VSIVFACGRLSVAASASDAPLRAVALAGCRCHAVCGNSYREAADEGAGAGMESKSPWVLVLSTPTSPVWTPEEVE
jgi:hypothetical protein